MEKHCIYKYETEAARHEDLNKKIKHTAQITDELFKYIRYRSDVQCVELTKQRSGASTINAEMYIDGKRMTLSVVINSLDEDIEITIDTGIHCRKELNILVSSYLMELNSRISFSPRCDYIYRLDKYTNHVLCSYRYIFRRAIIDKYFSNFCLSQFLLYLASMIHEMKYDYPKIGKICSCQFTVKEKNKYLFELRELVNLLCSSDYDSEEIYY